MSISVNGESQVPPGFRFHPTEEELLQYYLRKKVLLEKIDLDVILDVDLNKLEPWDIQGINFQIIYNLIGICKIKQKKNVLAQVQMFNNFLSFHVGRNKITYARFAIVDPSMMIFTWIH